MSGTVDGLNFFGHRLADTTPSFPDAPAEVATDANSAVATLPAKGKTEARSPARSRPQNAAQPSNASLISPPSSKAPIIPTPSPRPLGAPPLSLRIAASEASFAVPPCGRAGYAAALEPSAEPIGTALARSLTSSDLRTRIIEFGNEGFRREDADRILAGENPSVLQQIREGTLLVAQLKTQERRTIIDEAPMTEVTGTMDLAIVRNNCGTIAVERHHDVYGRSVNERLDDGIRGLGEIFKEKIIGFVRKGPGE